MKQHSKAAAPGAGEDRERIARREALLDDALAETFPASDPISHGYVD
ncbi:hypothetical protein [Paraburkholderia sp.]